jgi:DNA polymerase-3 subunit delta'
MLAAVWDDLVGQERAVDALRRAAERPVHAYLLVGPPGSGVEDAARGLAASLVADGEPDQRTLDLVRRGVHPDVVEFEPQGASYKVSDVRERILPEASRAPVEGARTVLVVLEAERLRGNLGEPASALLKTLEEPPPRTVLVLVTGTPDDVLETIRSRCQRIDLDPVDTASLGAALLADGVEPASAARAAALSGGQLARARALAGPLAALRAAFAAAPAGVDGTGATAARLAAALDAEVEHAAASVEERHGNELAEFDDDMERHGYDAREVQRLRRRIEARHAREVRRARIGLLLEGVTAIESVYRDALAGAPPLNDDVIVPVLSARVCAEALDACRAAREAFVVHEKGVVRLQLLLLSLPPATTVRAS